MEIRDLVAGSADQLVALFSAVLPGSATARADQLDEPEAFLRDPNFFVLGAYIDDAPVGLVWGLRMRSPSERPTTYVHEMDVHANWRREGMAVFTHHALSPWPAVANHDPTVVVGAHTPQITSDSVDAAFDLLRGLPDVVPPPHPDQQALDAALAGQP